MGPHHFYDPRRQFFNFQLRMKQQQASHAGTGPKILKAFLPLPQTGRNAAHGQAHPRISPGPFP